MNFNKSFKNVLLWAQVVFAIGAIFFTLRNLVDSFSRSEELSDKLLLIDRHRQRALEDSVYAKIAQLRRVNDSMLSAIILNTRSKTEPTLLDVRMNTLEDNLKQTTALTEALRQSINPMKPEEVLTIARLKDEIIELKKSVSDLDQSLKLRQQAFEDSIRRETTNSGQSYTLILVVLLPLILNFLYTLWKDFRDGKKEKIQPNQAE